MKQFRFINFLVITALSLLLGIRVLEDYDLGWHLAAGLWMIEHHAVPRLDFLGSEHSPWICYSWLAELFVAAVYQTGGFHAVSVLQTMLIVLSAWMILFVAQFGASKSRATPLNVVLTTLVALNFLAPFWHLRPQLLSVVFFALVIILAERRCLQLRWFLPLTIVWANIHVFWPLAILVFGIYGVVACREGNISRQYFLFSLLSLSCAGLFSPYGIDNLMVLADYAFSHHDASRLIDEFQRLTPSQGYVFYLYLVAVAYVLAFRFRAISLRTLPGVLIFLLCAGLALWQRKYLSLFAVAFALVAPRQKESSELDVDFLPCVYQALVALIVIGLCASVLNVPTLAVRYQQLLSIPEKLGQSGARESGRLNLLSSFDDGGWLGLAFWLNKKDSATEYQTSIDGRTLVMGPRRLRDYESLINLNDHWCEILERWKVDRAVLPADMKLTQALISSAGTRCADTWKLNEKVGSFLILQRTTPGDPPA